MEPGYLEYRLTAKERRQFDQEGYFIVPDALPASLVRDLAAVVDRLDRRYRRKHGIGSREMIHILDFIGRDDLFLRLLDWPLTFPKVWGILGWNIQLYHSDMILFYGYSYRWLRPRDDMTVDHVMGRCGSIRRQLLGAATGGMGYTSPGPGDVPLKTWMERHLPPEEVPV